MGKYDKLADAQVSKTGQYFDVGNYRVKILAVKDVESTKGGNKNYTVIETRVVESNNPKIPVGSERSQVIDMGNVMGLPNLKAFVAAASGVDATMDSVNDDIEAYWARQDPQGAQRSLGDIVEELFVGANVLEDVEMELTCVEVKKQNGDPFTKYIWGTRDISAD